FQPRDQFPHRPKYAIEVGGTTLSAERALDIVRRQWPLIVAIVAGTLALVLVYLISATPMYTANARILMDTRQTQVLDKDSGTANALIDPGFVDSQVEILQSDDLLLSIVRRLKLTEDPEFNGSEPGLLPLIIGKVIGLFGSDGP
ncbi:Wzz/FepE/Etk N-terminal domain-containing protein, partial [Xanthomonas citri pv. citri]